MNTSPDIQIIPREQPVATASSRRAMSIGLPRCCSEAEHRFPITPECAGILADNGYRLKMESGAPASIHYTDGRYTRQGVEIASRTATLECDIVIHLAALQLSDARVIRRGALLLTFLRSMKMADNAVVKELLKRGVTVVAIDLIEDEMGNTPFADTLAEIDGRASVAIASSLLADAVHGKGILIGGVAGVVPCEALIIGSGDTACAAARSAVGLGAIVRMMDNDIYRLRRAAAALPGGVITSSLHPRSLASALRTADIVVYTDIAPHHRFDREEVDTMKEGVVTFDLSNLSGEAFPSMTAIDLAAASTHVAPSAGASSSSVRRLCYINAGSAVPRTAAMAMSNIFISLMGEIVESGSALSAIKLSPGLQCAALTYLGHAVNRDVARIAGVRHTPISLYINLT